MTSLNEVGQRVSLQIAGFTRFPHQKGDLCYRVSPSLSEACLAGPGVNAQDGVSVVRVEDVPHATFVAMLNCLYLLELDPDASLAELGLLYVCADKYQITNLSAVVLSRISHKMSPHNISHFLFGFAFQHDALYSLTRGYCVRNYNLVRKSTAFMHVVRSYWEYEDAIQSGIWTDIFQQFTTWNYEGMTVLREDSGGVDELLRPSGEADVLDLTEGKFKIVLMPTFDDLPDHCILAAFRYCDSRFIAKCGTLSRRHARIVHDPILWTHVSVSGRVSSAALFIENVVLQHAKHIRSISFESISFTSSTVEGADSFFESTERLLAQIGSNLRELRIDDAVHRTASDTIPLQFRLPVPSSLMVSTTGLHESLFGDIHILLASVAKYCPAISKIVLSGDSDSAYVGDSNILLLTTSCPAVESFVDEECCGLSANAIKYMAKGWKSLSSLELDTDCMDVAEFKNSVSLFGDRIKRLSVTCFNEALDAEGFGDFLETLRCLKNLEVLAIDHSGSRSGTDGIDPDKMQQILTACPKLQGFEYFTTLEAYFDFEEEDDFRNFAATSSLSDYHGSNYAGGDTDFLIESYKTYRAKSMYSRSRRGSIGSVSMATTRFGKGRFQLASLSIFSKDEDSLLDDVTSLAPALPSPNEKLNRVEVYGMWSSGDKLSIRQRALRVLGFEEGSDFFAGKQEVFFAILDGCHAVCGKGGVNVTFAWSI
ncbi:hypothetical protein HDU78_010211 [Chytriomyces hyalinus]|nr:hypothetical protein HDU78_010211 [Chytriomyces hyalinus]